MRYSVEPRDQIFLKDYGCLSYAKNISKNIAKNLSKSLSRKYSQKPIDYVKESTTDVLKTAPKRAIKTTA